MELKFSPAVLFELDRLCKDGRGKVVHYVPKDHQDEELLKSTYADQPTPVRFSALKEIVSLLEAKANRQGKMRMTDTAGHGRRGQRPFIPNPHAGQHYPAIQSFLSQAHRLFREQEKPQ